MISRNRTKWTAMMGLLAIMALLAIFTVGSADAKAPPSLTISDASGQEGSTITFTISMNKKSGSDVLVTAKTSLQSGATASQDDFVAKEERITFPAGSTKATFTVDTVDDDQVERKETFFVYLSNPQGATIVRTRAKGSIKNDDVAPEDTPLGKLQADYDRVTKAIEDSLEGCLVFGDEGATGELIYVTDGDNVRCVPLRELTDATCIPHDFAGDQGTANTHRFSVYWKDGAPVYIGGLRDNMLAFDFQLSLPENGERASSEAVEGEVTGSGLHKSGAIDYKVYVSYTPQNSTLSFLAGDIQHDYDVASQEFDSPLPGSLKEESHGHSLDFLYQRMNDIALGNDYYIPADCLFTWKSDLRDRIHQPRDSEEFGDLKAGHPAQSELDNGPDLDLFEVDLSAAAEYALGVTGRNPADVNLNKVPFVSGAQEDGRTIGQVEPALRVLDQDGQELATSEEGTLASFSPSTDGTYYVEVSHANEEDWDDAGVYTLSVDLLKEGDDIASDTTTGARLPVGAQISAAISPAGDSDWFKIRTEAGKTYQIIAVGDDSDGQAALQEAEISAYRDDGTELDATEFQSSTVNGHWVGELRTSTAGKYFIEVSSQNSSGAYTVRSQAADDHMNLLDDPATSFGLQSAAQGTIEGGWDVDQIELSVPATMNYHVTIVPDNPGGSDVPDLSISAKKHPADSGKLATHNLSDGRLYVQLMPGWFTQDPTAQAGVTRRVIVEISPEGAAQNPVGYTVSVTTPQFLNVGTHDDHPDDEASLNSQDFLTLNGHGSVTLEGELNGQGDVDAFGINNWPGGTYHVDFAFDNTHGLVGMKVTLHKPGGISQDISNNGFTINRAFGTAEGYYISVSNHLEETTGPYKLTISN